jgi:serine-type D-Ala-D-Ala carboxypeptidase/endopeptidase
VSTTRDLAKFVQACLGLIETPIAPLLTESMRPRVAGDMPGRRIGLAWVVETEGQSALIWHNGMTGGYSSYLALQPAKKRGVALVTNHAIGIDALGKSLLLDFVRKESINPSVDVREYLGHYPATPAFGLTVTADGEQLFVQATNQDALKLRRVAGDRFAVQGPNAEVSFTRDDRGEIVGLVLHQGDRETPAKKQP